MQQWFRDYDHFTATIKFYIFRHFLTERLIEETKDIVAKNLMKEKEELLFRMQNNVNLLQDSLAEILSEIQDNSQHLESIVKKIRLDGGIVEADKLKLHIDELDSVTLLKTVLSVRLKTTQNKLELSKELKEMVSYLMYIWCLTLNSKVAFLIIFLT